MIAPSLKKLLEKINEMEKEVEAELAVLVGDSSLCLWVKLL